MTEKAQLNEYLIKKKLPPAVYINESKGSDHNKDFRSKFKIDGIEIESDWKKTKKESEHDCAKNVLKYINSMQSQSNFGNEISYLNSQISNSFADENLKESVMYLKNKINLVEFYYQNQIQLLRDQYISLNGEFIKFRKYVEENLSIQNNHNNNNDKIIQSNGILKKRKLNGDKNEIEKKKLRFQGIKGVEEEEEEDDDNGEEEEEEEEDDDDDDEQEEEEENEEENEEEEEDY